MLDVIIASQKDSNLVGSHQIGNSWVLKEIKTQNKNKNSKNFKISRGKNIFRMLMSKHI